MPRRLRYKVRALVAPHPTSLCEVDRVPTDSIVLMTRCCPSAAAPVTAHRWAETEVLSPCGGVSIHDDFVIHGSGPNHYPGGRLRRSLACHMRTNRSVLRSAARTGSSCAPLPIEAGRISKGQGGKGGCEGSVCPVIFGQEAYAAQRRREEAATIDRANGGSAAKL